MLSGVMMNLIKRIRKIFKKFEPIRCKRCQRKVYNKGIDLDEFYDAHSTFRNGELRNFTGRRNIGIHCKDCYIALLKEDCQNEMV